MPREDRASMIQVRDLAVRQGEFELRGVSFEVGSGEYVALMGRTGEGKTTILEAICGLRRMAGGHVWIGGRDVTGWTPAQRGIGYVPQDRALFSTMTVREHLAFALVLRRWSAEAMAERVAELASLLGIGHLLSRKPGGLSGGEAQRVALGRALAMRPEVLLFDEPLSALDDQTRDDLYGLLRLVRAQSPVTVLHVTHSAQDAAALADRVLVLSGGKVMERAMPQEAGRCE